MIVLLLRCGCLRTRSASMGGSRQGSIAVDWRSVWDSRLAYTGQSPVRRDEEPWCMYLEWPVEKAVGEAGVSTASVPQSRRSQRKRSSTHGDLAHGTDGRCSEYSARNRRCD